MSRASKLTLAATSLFAASTIAMHQGVVRDIEQQRIKRERQLDFDMQRALEEDYKREQTVRDATAPSQPSASGIQT
ncbi:uncharacterized protein CLUP02_10124 [Colletotrichum lupini]|uniref:Cytochrome c oxidase assembly protein n=3 Tax=Colletotrichum acutatum species complex TaxID=2707335 RepID=A0A9Q8SW25_9PEZI|nr:uncharacterized protein CLUP02_10124 [Colletotrichum lupini]XP_060313111.1 uncharacterized protein CCOS01_08676 [Colletotrichum costaricense]XP_060385381.1 uncharacterized protein CTAM01_03930 [Colletotrichum tamarilloi]KAI3529976.1 hypothetical protein CSPX01_15124 [Colletotrichum filicis]KAK1504623.1 hypothetical protein CTAM01_03930 [Colletotrichum tamarilloi]KAK1526258.1 hypothetical protein CCOS01_08676 [Colletotrichum costaricense]UQC84627.1 hypothetical protein CLUP02_10124 [Colleto